MPEGDTVFQTATALRDALAGKTLTRCDVRVPRYRHGRPVRRAWSTRCSVAASTCSSAPAPASIHSHLKMDGSWRIGPVRAAASQGAHRPGRRRRHGAVGVDLGVLEILERAHDLEAVAHLGPDLLGDGLVGGHRGGQPDDRPGSAACRGASGSARDGRRRQRVRQRTVLRFRSAARPRPSARWPIRCGSSPGRDRCCGPTGSGRTAPPRATPGGAANCGCTAAPDYPAGAAARAIATDNGGERVTYWCPVCQH